jgi:hypothetical protein
VSLELEAKVSELHDLMTPPLMTPPLIWQVSLELEAKVSELHEARADLKAARKAAARAQVSLVNGH